MPKRLRPLRPEDGPEARFALALRALRDRAGVEDETVFSVDTVSRLTGLSRQTIYAALSGRVPNRGTLAKIVRIWNGDVAAWIAKKTTIENEIELKRSRNEIQELEAVILSPREREIARWKARNKARAELPDSRGPGQRHVSPSSAQANEIVQQFARDLDELRRGAGMSLRQVASAVKNTYPDKDYARMPTSTLSYIFRGLRFPDWYQVEKIVHGLGDDTEKWRTKWVAMARTTELFKTWVDRVENRKW